MTDLDDISVVSGPAEEMLNARQLADYRDQREACLTWLLERGKDPETYDGYAEATVECRGNRMDFFYRWVWLREERYVGAEVVKI
jgi:hypothetical protein